MENATRLQCKALRGREKSRRRRNNAKQWKKQCAEQSKRSEIRASVPTSCRDAGRQATALRASRCQLDRVRSQDLRMSLGAIPGGRDSHTSETRISAIADLVRRQAKEK